MMIRAALAALILLAQPARAGPDMAAALRGDMADVADMAESVQAIYAEHGLSLPRFVWDFQPYDTVYSYIDIDEARIVTGSAPDAAELDSYWRAWSQALTGGAWDPARDFATAAQAMEMARLHSFVLALHEASHGMTYRYDPDHLARHGNAIGCREYYADRLVAAVLQDQADRNPDLERQLQEYMALFARINAAIPADLRARPTSFAEFQADCTVMPVAAPDRQDLRAYASAWAVRYQALLGTRLPPLPRMIETYLTGPLAERLALVPPAPQAGTLRLTPLGQTAAYGDPDAFPVQAIGPDGLPRYVEITVDKTTGQGNIRLSGADPATAIDIGLAVAPGLSRFSLASIAIIADDLAFLTTDEDAEVNRLWRLRPDAVGRWQAEPWYDTANYNRNRAYAAGPGRLLWALRQADRTWRAVTFDLTTDAIVANTVLPQPVVRIIGADAQGLPLATDGNLLIRLNPDGSLSRLAGSGLEGRDVSGSALTADLPWIEDTALQSDGSLILQIADDSSPGGYMFIRLAAN